MPSSDERRKGLRAALPAELYFNILASEDEFIRGQAFVLKRLSVIDSMKAPAPKTESQFFLSRIDQKLSLLIGMMAERSSRKSYLNHAAVIDISEFGLAFSSAMPIENGTSLEIGLQLLDSEVKMMDIGGRVVHVKTSPGPQDSTIYAYGVEFHDIQSKDQNEIVQWIFSHQREQIRRRRENAE